MTPFFFRFIMVKRKRVRYRGVIQLAKTYYALVVSYRTGGGHGEHEAIEEGLTSMVENPDNPTRFKIEESGHLNEKEIKELKKRIRERNTAT